MLIRNFSRAHLFLGVLFFVVLAANIEASSEPLIRLFKLIEIDVTALIRFIQTNTSSFIIFVVVSIYMEIILRDNSLMISSSSASMLKEALISFLRPSDPKSEIRAGIQKLVGEENVDALVGCLASAKQVYKDLDLTITIDSTHAKDGYLMASHETVFSSKSNSFVVAITCVNGLQDSLFNVTGIDEIFTCSRDEFESIEKGGACRVRIFQSAQTHNQRMATRELTPRLLKNDEVSELFGGELGASRGKVCLFGFTAVPDGESRRFNIRWPMFKAGTIGHYNWTTDRPTKVRSVVLNIVHGPIALQYDVYPNFYSFHTDQNLSGLRSSDFPIRLLVDSWILYGQGISISWKADNEDKEISTQ